MSAALNGLHVVGYSAAVLLIFWVLGIVFSPDGSDEDSQL